MLIQAEAGVASVTGGPEAPARVGVSVCDIAAGMNAYEAILEALIARGRTGEGAAISVSMFDAMADWMTVPLLQHEGGAPPKRIGLAHTSISPYGVFKSQRRRRHPDLDPERPRMARAGREGAGRQGARRRSEFRHQHRAGEAPRRRPTARSPRRSARSTSRRWSKKLAAADIAFGRVNGPARAGAAPASAPHHARLAERPAVLSGAGGAARRRAAALWPGAGGGRAQRKDEGRVRAAKLLRF